MATSIRPPGDQPRYWPKVVQTARAALASGLARPGTVTHLAVMHDDWCDLLHGRGPCNCNPDVKIMKVANNN